MIKFRLTAALAVALLAAPTLAAPPPGAAGPVTPVVIKQYSNGAPISTDEPLAVNCVTGCAGGGGGGSDAVVQGANTSGQSGVLIQGAVTTAAPTYTTAKTNPLSLTTAGGLRVDGSGVTQPVSDGGGSLTVDGTVAVTGTFWQATQPVSDAGGSLTVDGTVAATQSGTWNVTNISGTVSLPTGAATAANQTTGNTSLASIVTAVQGATPAGEAHIGEVGGNQTTITVAQTVTAASAYASGNAVGGLVTLASATRVSAGSGLIQSVVINIKSAQSTSTDVVFFSANPTGSTCTDKTAFSVAAADFDKVLGVVHVTDWTSLGTPSVGQGQNLAMPFSLASGSTIYACVVTRGTPTFAATSDVTVGVRVLRN